MSEDERGDRRRETVDYKARNMFATGGNPVTEPWAYQDYRENMEYVRLRRGQKAEIERRDGFVDDRIRDDAARTKRNTRLIIWVGGLLGSIITLVASGVLPHVWQFMNIGK